MFSEISTGVCEFLLGLPRATSLCEPMIKHHLFVRGLVEEEIDIKASNLEEPGITDK